MPSITQCEFEGRGPGQGAIGYEIYRFAMDDATKDGLDGVRREPGTRGDGAVNSLLMLTKWEWGKGSSPNIHRASETSASSVTQCQTNRRWVTRPDMVEISSRATCRAMTVRMLSAIELEYSEVVGRWVCDRS